MRLWTWLRKEWAKERWKLVEVVGVLAAGVGAILIPYALDKAADQRRDTEVDTLMKDLHGEAIKLTWTLYKDYIAEYRKAERAGLEDHYKDWK